MRKCDVEKLRVAMKAIASRVPLESELRDHKLQGAIRTGKVVRPTVESATPARIGYSSTDFQMRTQ